MLQLEDLSGVVYTRGESLQDGFRVVQNEITLASAYVLHYLSATWLQFQRIGRSPRWK